MSIIPMDISSSHEIRVKIITGYIAVWVVSSILATAGVFIGYNIVQEARNRINNAKTVDIYRESMALSGAMVLSLDDHGTVIKSNRAIDNFFAGGENIEGRNIHEFCVDEDARQRGVEGMKKWRLRTAVGSTKILLVLAKTSEGVKGIGIIAKAVPHQIGSNISVTAEVLDLNRVDYANYLPKDFLKEK